MKKQYLTIAALALVLGLTACSSKPAETTAAAATATAAETTAESTTEEEAVEDFFYGFVSDVADRVVTVADDEGKEVKFDFSAAEVTGADEIGVGDEVEVTFEGELADDVTKAKSIDVITSEAAVESEEEMAGEDEVVNGTIEKADDKTVTLKNDEGTYTFNSIIAQKVTKGGIKEGTKAEITFYGDLDDTTDLPVATRIVTEDAADTDEANIKTLTGKAAEVGSDHIVLDTADPENTLFSFVGEDGMFDGIEVGDTVTVIYDGTLTDRAIRAEGIQ